MNREIDDYVNAVVHDLVVDDDLKRRIAQDLRIHVTEASRDKSAGEVIEAMGNPGDVAREFMDTVYEDKGEVIERLIAERLKVNRLLENYLEYRSRIRIFGLPLLHVKFRRHTKARPGTARGIVALGNRAVGLIAIGKMSAGALCLGLFSFGLMPVGLVSVGLLALGSLSIGVVALGGFAFGLSAFGGFAFGLIAGGGFARGVVAMGGHVSGQYLQSSVFTSVDQIKDFIRQAFPRLGDWILNILVFFRFLYT